VVAEHQEAVFRLAYLLLGDSADAEDVAQEAFIRAFRALHRFDQERPLRPWLLRIAANLARNRRRSIGRHFAALQRLARGASGAVVPPPTDDSRQDSWSLWQAIRQLDAVDQEIIYLRYFLEVPIAEAAQILGIAPGTVKSRLYRALGRLRHVVEREFPALWEEGGA
jgi:RNA polymerase sigma-70 factor (ECF subfamily)